jgi:hydrogenase maturation factor HypF (carbamoyltransferase family)
MMGHFGEEKFLTITRASDTWNSTPQLGGDAAGRFPHRMLYSILRSFLSPEAAAPFVAHCFSTAELALLEKQFVEQFHAPLTSSCGRVLDAAAALLGICDERTYEGRPAMLLEALSTTPFILPPVIQDGVLQTGPPLRLFDRASKRRKGVASLPP